MSGFEWEFSHVMQALLCGYLMGLTTIIVTLRLAETICKKLEEASDE